MALKLVNWHLPGKVVFPKFKAGDLKFLFVFFGGGIDELINQLIISFLVKCINKNLIKNKAGIEEN